MNLLKSRHWVAIALGILGGATNAIACVVTPDSILTEGQTLQLVADCGTSKVKTINWYMAIGTGTAVSLTGDVTLNQAAPKKVYFTTPVGLTSAGTGEYVFSVAGTSVGSTTPGDLTTSEVATVVVKPASAAVALARGVNPVTPVDASCGTPPGTALQNMPTGTAQCSFGSKAALAISGPESFTWSCLSLTGGAEANCYGLRGFTVTANAGANGSISPSSLGVAAGGTATFSAAPAAGYTAAISGCGGTQAGNNFTTGPVTANCTVTASFTNAPINGACGSASNTTAVIAAPSANLCDTGSATVVAEGATAYTWGCNGSNGGSDTTATACQKPRGYTVTTMGSDANGTISAGKIVKGGTTTTFTVTPATGYAATVTGCGGSLSGTTYTTGAISADCTVAATFDVRTVSQSDPGIGSGLWLPPGTTNRVVADQSSASMKSSYIPGCLNGQFAKDSSSGCANNDFYTGKDSTGAAYTVNLGSSKTLMLRYKTPASVTNGKTIKVAGWNGGSVSVGMRIWLSTDPLSTYATASEFCKATNTVTPAISTGAEQTVTTTTTVWGFTTTSTVNYCRLDPNTVYYFGVEFSDKVTGMLGRDQVDESNADFLP